MDRAANDNTNDLSPVSPSALSHQSDDEAVGLLHRGSLSEKDEFACFRNRQRRWAGILLLALAILASFALGVGVTFVVMQQIYLPRTRHVVEVNDLVPEFPLRRITFWSDPLATPDHKTEESHNATEDYWRSFQPIGNGWISVPDHEKYTLPRPLTHGNTTTGYFISMYHQLHCLHNIITKYNQLSDAYDRALAGDLTPLEDSSFSSSSSSSSSHHHHHARALTHDPSPSETRFLRRHFHVDHCIRYLRQALLCCGDTTLEGMNPAYDEAAAFDALDRDFVAVSDGTGMVHACKDHERIREWAEGRRVDDEWVT